MEKRESTAVMAAGKCIAEVPARPAESILTEAARIRSGERNADYGDAVEITASEFSEISNNEDN